MASMSSNFHGTSKRRGHAEASGRAPGSRSRRQDVACIPDASCGARIGGRHDGLGQVEWPQRAAAVNRLVARRERLRRARGKTTSGENRAGRLWLGGSPCRKSACCGPHKGRWTGDQDGREPGRAVQSKVVVGGGGERTAGGSVTSFVGDVDPLQRAQLFPTWIRVVDEEGRGFRAAGKS